MSENSTQEPLESEAIEIDAFPAESERSGSKNVENASIQTKPAKKEENLLVSLGFALGLGALFFLNTYGIPAVLGLLFSAIGLVQVNRRGEEGRGYAIWGMALSLLSLIWLGLQYLGLVTTPGMLFNFIKGLLGFRT